jgi:HSP20 family protein
MAALSRWHIFRELSSLQDRVRNLFRRVVAGKDPEEESWDGALVPTTDIRDTGDKLIYELDVPGISRKDIDVSVYGNVLMIRAERKRSHEVKKVNWLLSETLYGAFGTSFELPETVDPDSIKADYSHGVLRIELAKRAWARPTRIPIRSGSSLSPRSAASN